MDRRGGDPRDFGRYSIEIDTPSTLDAEWVIHTFQRSSTLR